MRPATLSGLLALWIGALGTILVCALAALSYLVVANQLEYRARDHLEGKAAQLQHALSERSDLREFESDGHQLHGLLIGHEELHIAITHPGTRIPRLSSSNIGRDSISKIDATPGLFTEWLTRDGTRLLSLTALATMQDGSNVLALLTVDRLDDDELLASLTRAVLSFLPVAIVVVVISAWWVARKSLSSLFRLRQAASSISARDLSYRVPITGLPAELLDLATTFNQMLERVEEGVSRLTRFSGDLAHEFRTPISILLGKTQVVLSKARPADQYRRALESNIEEFDRLGRLIDDMLFLAQADHSQLALHREWVNLDDEIVRVISFFESTAEEQGISMHREGRGIVHADRLMTQRAILNLVSNAVRHTPRDGSIQVRVAHADDGCITLTVANSGPSIPSVHLARLFERFYRADTGRSRHRGGTGLGLAIVKSIMALHDGTVQVKNGDDGMTRFILLFPEPDLDKARIAHDTTGAPYPVRTPSKHVWHP